MKNKLDQFLCAHPPVRFAADVVDVYFSKRVSRWPTFSSSPFSPS